MTPVTGYSDRINHALAFAAKHHERQVHKGLGHPYRTHAANVAIILSRYGRDDDTVVAGILHGVVADCLREGYTRAMLDQRIGAKFGDVSLERVLAIVPRPKGDDDIELSHDEVRDDRLVRLGSAGEESRWVCAADALHDACSTLADLRRTIEPDSVWGRVPLGREGTITWQSRLLGRLREVGFDTPIVAELESAIEELSARQLL